MKQLRAVYSQNIIYLLLEDVDYYYFYHLVDGVTQRKVNLGSNKIAAEIDFGQECNLLYEWEALNES